MQEYCIQVLAACALREVRQRERFYPRLIQDGRMAPSFARSEIDKMRAIYDLLSELTCEHCEREAELEPELPF